MKKKWKKEKTKERKKGELVTTAKKEQ